MNVIENRPHEMQQEGALDIESVLTLQAYLNAMDNQRLRTLETHMAKKKKKKIPGY